MELALVALEAEWEPLAELFGGAIRHDPGDGEPGTKDCEADAGVTPGDFLHDGRHEDSGRIAEGIGDKVERVQARTARLPR